MAQQTMKQVSRSWTTRRDEKRRRMQLVQTWMEGPILPKAKIVEALETLIVSGDRIVLEGDNQKQADFLSQSLVKVDPKRLHDLHLIISSISRPEHLTLFELGIAKKWISLSLVPKACASRNCWRMASSRLAPSTRMSNCMRGCWWTWYQMWFSSVRTRRMLGPISTPDQALKTRQPFLRLPPFTMESRSSR